LSPCPCPQSQPNCVCVQVPSQLARPHVPPPSLSFVL
jgi:hypothetical protein